MTVLKAGKLTLFQVKSIQLCSLSPTPTMQSLSYTHYNAMQYKYWKPITPVVDKKGINKIALDMQQLWVGVDWSNIL